MNFVDGLYAYSGYFVGFNYQHCKDQKSLYEIHKVCAQTICNYDNISDFKEKLASAYNEEWRHQRTCGEPDFLSV